MAKDEIYAKNVDCYCKAWNNNLQLNKTLKSRVKNKKQQQQQLISEIYIRIKTSQSQKACSTLASLRL